MRFSRTARSLTLALIVIVGTVWYVSHLLDQEEKKNALFEAVRDADLDAIEVALDNGASLNMKDPLGQTVLHSSAYKSLPKITRFLIEQGANLEARDKKGGTPLHWAVINGKIENVKLLLENGSNPNATDDEGKTPMHWLVDGMKINITTKLGNGMVLLANGADPTIEDDKGFSAKDYAEKRKLNLLVQMFESK